MPRERSDCDPVTGDCYNYSLSFGRHATYKIYCTSQGIAKTDILATVTGPDVSPAYVHSFFLAEDYVVLCIWTAHFASMGLAALGDRELRDAIPPSDQKATMQRFVVDRRAGRGLAKRFSGPAMFCFHTPNAFEEKQADGSVDILADLVEYPSLDILHRMYYENLASDSEVAHLSSQGDRLKSTRANMARYRLSNIGSPDLRKAAAAPSPEAARITHLPPLQAGELSTIDPAYHTKQHGYVYGLSDRSLCSSTDGSVNTNLQTGETNI